MNANSLYMGLFLIGFALYGFELITPRVLRAQLQKQEVQAAENENLNQSLKLEKLFQKISGDSLFKQSQSLGMSLKMNFKTITLTFYGEDVYDSGAFAMSEAWLSALDRLKDYLAPEFEHGLKVQVRAYADAQDARERTSSDYGESDLAFSFARAEWVARYFERKWGFPIHDRFELVGVGAKIGGKKTEIILSYQ